MIKALGICCCILLLINSCAKEDTIEIKGWEKVNLGDCNEIDNRYFVIQEEEELISIFNDAFKIEICERFEFPVIDFEDNTILGYKTISQSCNPNYRIELMLNPNSQSYIFNVHTFKNNNCESSESIIHWILIPKIHPDYSVSFHQIN